MSKSWASVASDPTFQALPAEEQAAAKSQYFQSVVAPQIQDPAEQKEALSQFMAEGVPRGTNQESTQEPGFYSPGEVASRAGQGLVSGVPGLRAGLNIAQGKDAYAPGAEGAGQIAGDIGGTASAIASGGIVPLVKFAGLSAALNAAGVPQGAHALGTQVENQYDQWTGANKPFESKGKGIDMARGDAPIHAAVLDDFKDQLLIAFLRMLVDKDGTFDIAVAEVDETGRYLLAFSVNNMAFHFVLEKKQ